MIRSVFMGDLLQVNSNGDYKVSTSDWWQNDNDKQPYKPLLYPLSCLTETIIHNGKEEIPLVELAKIEGFLCEGDQYKIKDDAFIIDNIGFYYNQTTFYIKKNIQDKFSSDYLFTINHLLLFDYLYSRRINIWGIDAIDPRTLEVNPYLI